MGRGPWGQAAGGYPGTSATGAVPSPKACSSPDSQTLRGWDWAPQEAVSAEEKCHGHFYFRNRAGHSVFVHWGPPTTTGRRRVMPSKLQNAELPRAQENPEPVDVGEMGQGTFSFCSPLKQGYLLSLEISWGR